mgnify:CR=1 FL=1
MNIIKIVEEELGQELQKAGFQLANEEKGVWTYERVKNGVKQVIPPHFYTPKTPCFLRLPLVQNCKIPLYSAHTLVGAEAIAGVGEAVMNGLFFLLIPQYELDTIKQRYTDGCEVNA